MNKKKILLLQYEISPYRVETYNLIAHFFDFTVGFIGEDKTVNADECKFKKLKIPCVHFGSVYWYKGLYKICKDYDVVITLADLHMPQAGLLSIFRSKFKIIYWSIGLRASYTRPYCLTRKHTLLDWIMLQRFRRSDANIFYMPQAIEFWKGTKLNRQKCFTAINTVKVIETEHSDNFDSILFIGTLYAGKGIDILIHAFSEAIKATRSKIKLNIVGKGAELDNLKNLAHKLNIDSQIIFHGAIYDEEKLAPLFNKSLVCVSPSQAGLSVAKSMGYGVPFITRKNAITGGEVFHITSGINGVIYDTDSDLTKILIEVITMPEKYIEMGKQAKQYYNSHATPFHMAKGVCDAISYALKNK